MPTSSSSESRLPFNLSSNREDGSLIGLLTVSFYILFTLLPSSHSLMVSWPWVAVWQVALLLPIIWLLWQLWFKPLSQFKLGSGLDWPFALLVIGLGISTLFGEFPNQTLWYSWAALGGIAALYALSGWLTTPQKAMVLLRLQALLGLAFILLSLGLWLFQTYFPEMERLAALAPYGVAQKFDFGVTSLRNWYPLGHQNYVAGYLVLILPLLFGLGITDRGWQRLLWISGCCLGLVDLYTASSRGGLIALVSMVAIALAITLLRSRLPRRIVFPIGVFILCALVATTLINSRIRRPLLALLQGKINNSELGYRVITNTIGWRIGIDHPFTGSGPGSVLQLYQKYRPYWAGREAELHFQLHSTPAQLWAELGIWGITALVSLAGLIGWLTWCWLSSKDDSPFINTTLTWSLLAGLFAYSLMGLTDYQLDTPAIGGGIVLYVAVLAKVYQSQNRSTSANHSPNIFSSRLWASLGIGLILAINFWLLPVHRAWALSKQGFEQLSQGNFDRFEQSLTQAHHLAPWEPYYPSILAWTLGDFSFQAGGASQGALRVASISWFETANSIAPYQEFGQSNLGWLLSQENPEKSVTTFAKAAQLVPAKQGVFLGLGLSLLRNNQPTLATDALVLELLRFPLQITSPIWQLGELASVKETVFSQLEAHYTQLLNTSNSLLQSYLKRQQGALNWWQGNYDAAAYSWQDFPTGKILLQLANGETLKPEKLPDNILGRQAMLAWLLPDQRRELLERALIRPRDDLPQFNTALPTTEQVDQLSTAMDQATSFDDWLKNSRLIEQPRSQRVGFGALNRHIDGPFPLDYAPRIVNQPVEISLASMLSASPFFPELDTALQPQRQKLLSQIKSSLANPPSVQ